MKGKVFKIKDFLLQPVQILQILSLGCLLLKMLNNLYF
jgi:hypothetical protein